MMSEPERKAGDSDKATSISWSPSGTRIAIGKKEGVVVFDAKTLREIPTAILPTTRGSSAQWCPSENHNALAVWSGDDPRRILIWSMDAEPDPVRKLTFPADVVCFDWFPPPSRRIAASCADRFIRVVDVETGRCDEERVTATGDEPAASIIAHEEGRVAFNVMPNGTAAADFSMSPHYDGEAVVTKTNALYVRGRRRGLATCTAWHPSIPILAIAHLEKIELLDVRDDKTGTITVVGCGDLCSIAWSPDGESLAAGTRREKCVIVDNLFSESARRVRHRD